MYRLMPPKKTTAKDTKKSSSKKESKKDSKKDAKKSSKKDTKKKDSKKADSKSKSKKTDSKSKSGEKSKEEKTSKKYDLPGQKKDTPDELDAVRMFYESAYKENPMSEMAARWCLIHGLLPPAVATQFHTKGFEALTKAAAKAQAQNKKVAPTAAPPAPISNSNVASKPTAPKVTTPKVSSKRTVVELDSSSSEDSAPESAVTKKQKVRW